MKLTDEEITRVWMLNGGGLAANRYFDFARAIEALVVERCAKVCEGVYKDFVFDAQTAGYVGMAVRDCAAAIRSLK